MTFKEAYNLVNDKKQCIAVYTIAGQGLEDFIIHQTLICAAKMEPHKDEIREEMGLPCDGTDIVLLDGKNNEVVRGLPNETHWLNIYLSIDDTLKALKKNLKYWKGDFYIGNTAKSNFWPHKKSLRKIK